MAVVRRGLFVRILIIAACMAAMPTAHAHAQGGDTGHQRPGRQPGAGDPEADEDGEDRGVRTGQAPPRVPAKAAQLGWRIAVQGIAHGDILPPGSDDECHADT